MGAELTDKTIPGETGLIELTVSFTKGCYTGQELVARIDSRGSNVARRLRRIDAVGPVTSGDEVTGDGGVGGRGPPPGSPWPTPAGESSRRPAQWSGRTGPGPRWSPFPGENPSRAHGP